MTTKLNLKNIESKIEKINEKIEQQEKARKSACYWYELRATSKTLKFNAKAKAILNENGININQCYISYNNKAVFNAIEQVFSQNSNIFVKREDIEK